MSDYEENWDDEPRRRPESYNSSTNYSSRNGYDNRYKQTYESQSGGSKSFRRNDRYENRERRQEGGGYQGGMRRENYDRSNEVRETIEIDPSSVGRIIGRNGSTVQRIQTDFHVYVKVDSSSGTVTVSGQHKDDVQKALQYISEQGAPREEKYRDRGYQRRAPQCQFEHEETRHAPQHQSELEETSVDSGVIDWTSLNSKAEVVRKERWAKLPPLEKHFYKEAPEVANMPAEEAAHIRAENNNITVSRVFKSENNECNDIPNPVWKFEQCFESYPDMLAEIYKQQFTKPSPIQSQAWPILLKGEDLIGIAQTGTGKTLAFLLPAMIHIEYQETPRGERGGPNVLILAPTRELALQIEKEVKKYSFRGIKAVCVYGGGSRKEQINSISLGVEIIICTPGRLNDLIEAKVIDVSSVTYLVLDEADRMLDMGFEPQIRKVLLDIRPDRQTIMTSATWPPGVRRLAQSYMSNPIQVCVGTLDLAATHTVKQLIDIMDEGDKYYHIRKFIREMNKNDKVIVFCGKKSRADDLSSDLTLAGYSCQCIHGSRDQSDREQAIADITSGEVSILIATDVASRGLDIEDVTHVINYDFPRNIEEYVHRVGRTGRAGRTGISISYLTRQDWGVAKELIDILEEADQDIPDELRGMAQRFSEMKERRGNEGSRFDRRHHNF